MTPSDIAGPNFGPQSPCKDLRQCTAPVGVQIYTMLYMRVTIQDTPLAHSSCSLLAKRYTYTIFCAMSAHIPAGLLCIQPSTLYLSKSISAQKHSPICEYGCMSTVFTEHFSWRWHAACNLDEPGLLCELSLSKQAAEAFFFLVALIFALCLRDNVWVFYGRVQTLPRALLWRGRR